MKRQIDFLKIFEESKKGDNKLIGVLNINNMIPVDESVIRKVDMTIHDKDNGEVKAHKRLMQKQLCRKHPHSALSWRIRTTSCSMWGGS